MDDKNYQVLALKYRPKNFDDLIGQDVLVQTITNAVNSDRIANAFVLTGIRGVGKTTAARIIAKVLNCSNEAGNGKPTANPCGVCENCVAIKEYRHTDVIEMDAASHTGVDDIREIIDNCKYLPNYGRYKIYIIDEVHMLSKNAFNALLKTLEEPPAHVKFIFATTEIRKIPITILSRCQRFDLRRIEMKELFEFLKKISTLENADIEDEAIKIIANSSEGSVRDSLSLLDQVISHSRGVISADNTREMLGLADKSSIIDIFDYAANGESAKAIEKLNAIYNASADPILILNDLLEFSYIVTKIKAIPNLEEITAISENEFKRAKIIAGNFPMSFLTKSWQILLKGLDEAKSAPNSLSAVEMIIIRLCYLSNLPSPATIIKNINDGKINLNPVSHQLSSGLAGEKKNFNLSENLPLASNKPLINLSSFEDVVALFKKKKEILHHTHLIEDVSLVSFETGKIVLKLIDVQKDFPNKIAKLLKTWTNESWIVSASDDEGEQTIAQKNIDHENDLKQKMTNEPEINKILEVFPNSYINNIEKIN